MLKWLVNPAQRKLLALFLVIFLLTGVMLVWQSQQTARSIMQARLQQNMALLGYLAEQQLLQPDDLTNGSGLDHRQLAAILDGQFTVDQQAAGSQWLARYGLDDENITPLLKDYRPLLLNLVWRLTPVSLIGLLLFGAAAALIMQRLFCRILAMADFAGRVATHPEQLLDSSNRQPDRQIRQEGDLAVLQQSLQQLAEKAGGLLQALQADKQYLKDFLSDISHQVKTPLATLRIDHDLMLEQPDMPPEKRRGFLQQDLQQLDRIEWLIQGLLKMARLEAGAVQMKLRPGMLLDTVRQAAAPFESLTGPKRIRLEIDVPETIQVDHDQDWVAEAVSNLIKNAVEHTPEGGQICIAAVRTPVTVQLKVSDTGPGLASDEIPRIFERFYQKRSHSQNDSVGIGLSLAKTIFEQNGADLTASSQPGHGAVFTATFLIRQ